MTLFDAMDKFDKYLDEQLSQGLSDDELIRSRMRQLIYHANRMVEVFSFDFDGEIAKIVAVEPIDMNAIEELSKRVSTLNLFIREINKAQKLLNDY